MDTHLISNLLSPAIDSILSMVLLRWYTILWYIYTGPAIDSILSMVLWQRQVGPGRAMPDQKYGPEIINGIILIIILILINYLLVIK